MFRNKAMPELDRTRPQADSQNGFKLCDSDDVAVPAACEELLDGGPVQIGVSTDSGQCLPLNSGGDIACEALSDTHLNGCAGGQVAGEEVRAGAVDVVDGSQRDSSAAWHGDDPTDSSGGGNKDCAPASNLVDCREEPAVSEVVKVNERDRLIGQRVHALIAAHLRSGVVPTPREVWVSASKVFAAKPLPQNAACRQRAACATSAYFSIFHQPEWHFLGAEVDLGTGRVDLLWEVSPGGSVVIDEIKMAGFADHVDDPATVAQVRRYCEAGVTVFGERFLGVRLLPLAAPGRALWCPLDGSRIRLVEADGLVA